MVKIKICGMRRVDDIMYVNKYKPDYVGFILSEGFKRTVAADKFCELKDCLDNSIKSVGVFVNEPIENILKNYADKLDVIQLHGDENVEYIENFRKKFSGEIWKAVRAKAVCDIENACGLPVDKLLIDSYSEGSYGGTGKRADTNIITKAEITKPFFLAGGISAENAAEAVSAAAPYGVDLSSSVETDGFKDEEKIREIISIVRGL